MILEASKAKVGTVIVLEKDLVKPIKELGVRARGAEDTMTNQVYEAKLDIMVEAGFTSSREESRELVRELSIKIAEERLRSLSGRRDLQVVEAVQALDEMDRSLNILIERVREWYGLHFPELSSVVNESTDYLRIVDDIGHRDTITPEILTKSGFAKGMVSAIMKVATDSKGGDFQRSDIEIVSRLAEEALRLGALRNEVVKFVEASTDVIAPNLSAIAGSTIGARLIAKAGGLERLARLPTTTVQLLGAEKALFRALKTGAKPPKHGILFQHNAVHTAPKWQRGKIARSLAGKASIAVRIDAFRGTRDTIVDRKLKKRLDEIMSRDSKPPSKIDMSGRRGTRKRRSDRSGYRR